MRRSLKVTLLVCAGFPLLIAGAPAHSSALPPNAVTSRRMNSAKVGSGGTPIKFPANVSHQISSWTPEKSIRRVWLGDRGRSLQEPMATADWLVNTSMPLSSAHTSVTEFQQRPVVALVAKTGKNSPLLAITFLLPTFAGFALGRTGRRPAKFSRAVVSRTRDIYFIAERDGGLRNDSPEGFGLYYHDCRYLSGYELRIAGAAPTGLFANASKSFMTEFELAHPQLQLENGDALPERWLGMSLYRVVENPECAVHDVLTVENYGDKEYEIPLSFEFRSDFAKVDGDATNLGRRHEPVWQDGVLTMSFDANDGLMRRLDIHMRPKPDKVIDSQAHFRLRLGARRREQVTVSFRIVESVVEPMTLPLRPGSESFAG